jgi:hypothetical protein
MAAMVNPALGAIGPRGGAANRAGMAIPTTQRRFSREPCCRLSGFFCKRALTDQSREQPPVARGVFYTKRSKSKVNIRPLKGNGIAFPQLRKNGVAGLEIVLRVGMAGKKVAIQLKRGWRFRMALPAGYDCQIVKSPAWCEQVGALSDRRKAWGLFA